MKSQQGTEVVVAVDDLYFATRIESVAQATGRRVIQAPEPSLLWAALRERVPGLIIFDLNSRVFDSVDLVKKIKADPRLEGIRLVGFYSHVDAELGRAAEMAGCEAMRRSVFVAKLPELLKS